MNKGRNIFLLMVCMLCVSVLAFFTIFEHSNTEGVVDRVRFIVDSEEDGVKTISLYFVSGEPRTCTASESYEGVTFVVENSDFSYRYDGETGRVLAYRDGAETDDPAAFELLSEKLFRRIVEGGGHYIVFYQAAIVAAVCFLGGAIILYAEELWHWLKKKGPDEIPAWKDMNGIRIAGGCVIAAGVVLLIVFILT